MELSKEPFVSDEFIYLPYLNLTELPDNYEKTNPNIICMDLRHNIICIWPKLENFKFLSNLNLSFNNLVEISANIRFLESLENIKLDHNKIEDLSNLALCSNLKFISAVNNNIKNVSIFLTDLIHLKMLNLSHNYIKEIPDDFKKIPNLYINLLHQSKD
jgi:Leucine-rich repeat (LRR) protein